MKLSNEEIAKVFAMYLGHKVHVGLYNYDTTINAVDKDGNVMLQKGPTDYPQSFICPEVWQLTILPTNPINISEEYKTNQHE